MEVAERGRRNRKTNGSIPRKSWLLNADQEHTCTHTHRSSARTALRPCSSLSSSSLCSHTPGAWRSRWDLAQNGASALWTTEEEAARFHMYHILARPDNDKAHLSFSLAIVIKTSMTTLLFMCCRVIKSSWTDAAPSVQNSLSHGGERQVHIESRSSAGLHEGNAKLLHRQSIKRTTQSGKTLECGTASLLSGRDEECSLSRDASRLFTKSSLGVQRWKRSALPLSLLSHLAASFESNTFDLNKFTYSDIKMFISRLHQLFLIPRCILGVCAHLFLHHICTSVQQASSKEGKKPWKTTTFASLSPSSLFTTLSWVASAWPDGRQKRKRRRKETIQHYCLMLQKTPAL